MNRDLTRPPVVVAVVGAATEIGKTWVTAHALGQLRERGLSVAVRKPVQSFDPSDSVPTDAAVLAVASGEDASAVCAAHRQYELAMAPPMAADVLGRPPIMIGDLVTELAWPDDRAVDVGFVETAGGVRSPVAHDGDSIALAAAINPDVVALIADAGLGTINAVRLCVAALSATPSPAPVIVVLNRFDPDDELHVLNREWLASCDGLNCVGTVDELVDELLAVLDARVQRDA